MAAERRRRTTRAEQDMAGRESTPAAARASRGEGARSRAAGRKAPARGLLAEDELEREVETGLPAEDEVAGGDGEGGEDLVEVRVALGPDGLPQMLTDAPGDDTTPVIERDLNLEQEVEKEAHRPLDEVIEEWGDPTVTSDPVRMYLHEIGRTALLTGEEEVTLATAILEGKDAIQKLKAEDLDEEMRDALMLVRRRGRAAEQRLAQANLRLVVSVAKRYVGRGMSFLT